MPPIRPMPEDVEISVGVRKIKVFFSSVDLVSYSKRLKGMVQHAHERSITSPSSDSTTLRITIPDLEPDLFDIYHDYMTEGVILIDTKNAPVVIDLEADPHTNISPEPESATYALRTRSQMLIKAFLMGQWLEDMDFQNAVMTELRTHTDQTWPERDSHIARVFGGFEEHLRQLLAVCQREATPSGHELIPIDLAAGIACSALAMLGRQESDARERSDRRADRGDELTALRSGDHTASSFASPASQAYRYVSPTYQPNSPAFIPRENRSAAPEPISPTYQPNSPAFTPRENRSAAPEPISPTYQANSPAFIPRENRSAAPEPISPTYQANSPAFIPREYVSQAHEGTSPAHEPTSPGHELISPAYGPATPLYGPVLSAYQPEGTIDFAEHIFRLLAEAPIIPSRGVYNNMSLGEQRLQAERNTRVAEQTSRLQAEQRYRPAEQSIRQGAEQSTRLRAYAPVAPSWRLNDTTSSSEVGAGARHVPGLGGSSQNDPMQTMNDIHEGPDAH